MKRRTLKRLRPGQLPEHHHNVYVVLLEPAVGKIRKVRAENPKRNPKKPCIYVGMTGLCQYSSVDGAATGWHLVHLGSRAVGGAGLVVAEASAVSPEGRITPGDAGIWADKHVEPVARIHRFLKEHGAVPGIQIAHAGRKASAARPWEGGAHLADQDGGWPIIAPSALAFGGDLTKVPRAMSLEEITRVQEEFVAAAKRSLAAVRILAAAPLPGGVKVARRPVKPFVLVRVQVWQPILRKAGRYKLAAPVPKTG